MRLLNLPLPIFAAALVQQIEPPAISAPAWVTAFLVGVFVLAYVLNLVGKFPGAAGERRESGYTEADRTRLTEVHGVVTREDSDKPGWHMVWYPARETREIRDLLIELSDLREDWAAEREEWRAERSRMETRITHLEEVNRIQGHALQHGNGGGTA